MEYSIVTGSDLLKIKNSFRERYCIEQIKEYLASRSPDICALFGLRRTGKTVLMQQCIEYLLTEKKADVSEIIYMTLPESTSFKDVDLLSILEDHKDTVRYVFVDEISYMNINTEDNNLNLLSDVYCALGMRIVVAGTLSYFIRLLSKEVLFDRIQMVDTTYFSFKEAHEILGLGIEEFIEYGGIIRGDKEKYTPDEYLETAVTSNIVRSLVKSDRLYELAANDPEFDRIVSMEPKRRDAKLGSLIKQTIDRFMNTLVYESIPRIDRNTYYDLVLERLETIGRGEISDKTFDAIIKVLKDIRLIEDINISGMIESCFVSYYLRYGLCTEIINTVNDRIMQDTNERYSADLTSDVLKGNIVKAIIDMDLYKSNRYKFCKYRNSEGFEVDLIIIDDKSETIDLYEIKYADEAKPEQVKNIINADFIAEILYALKKQHGHAYKVNSYNVLYNGKARSVVYNPSEVFESLEKDAMAVEKFEVARRWGALREKADVQGWNQLGFNYKRIFEYLVAI